MTTSPRYFVERPPNVLDSPLGVYGDKIYLCFCALMPSGFKEM